MSYSNDVSRYYTYKHTQQQRQYEDEMRQKEWERRNKEEFNEYEDEMRQKEWERKQEQERNKEEFNEYRRKRDGSGYASNIKEAGYTAYELRSVEWPENELKKSGFTLSELRVARYSVADLIKGGYNESDIKDIYDAGYSLSEITEYNGYEKFFSERGLKSAGYDNLDKLLKNNISKDKLNSYGYSNSEILTNLSKSKMYYSEFKFMQRLRYSGFTVHDLKEAGYTAYDLILGEYKRSQMSDDFLVSDIKEALSKIRKTYELYPMYLILRNNGFTMSELKEAGFSIDYNDLNPSEISIYVKWDHIKEIFTAEELRKIGYTPNKILELGFNLNDLKEAGFSAEELGSKYHYESSALIKAGFTKAESVLHGKWLGVKKSSKRGKQASKKQVGKKQASKMSMRVKRRSSKK